MNSLNILSSRVIKGGNASRPSRPRARSQEPGRAFSSSYILSPSSPPPATAPRSYSLESLKKTGPLGYDATNPSSLSSPDGEYPSTAAHTLRASVDHEPVQAAPNDGCELYEGRNVDEEGSQGDRLNSTGKGEARGRGHNAKSPSQTIASVDFKAYFRVDRKLLYLAQRLVDTLTTAVKAILATLAAPAVYVARTFRTDEGRYSALAPLRRLRRRIGRAFGRSPARGDDVTAPYSSPLESLSTEKPSSSGRRTATGSRRSKRDSPYRTPRRSPSADSLSSNASETDAETKAASRSKSPNASSSSSPSSSLTAPPRRSIRIEVSDEGNRSRRRNSVPIPEDDENIDLSAADMLKSPMSSSHKLTRYPQAYPVPPRPLIPPRQPSYSEHNRRYPQKTLVLDLDETLIHSLAKGGRMSSGHMVEVRLSSPVAVAPPTASPSGQAQAQTPAMLGLQHPILYYVHKRPHCDDFLRKVCKWYRLVIFTASVQEYADPVIDWLEQERKYFHTRYYRQHCTFRNGAYIKDLSSVEPDLSKVMILDNSPMSYVFHEDNAIPIQGWISDPGDNDLLNLIPLLESLQYVTDVRALLALRKGEVEA